MEIVSWWKATVIDGWNYWDVEGDTATGIRIESLPTNGILFLDRDGDNRVDCHEAISVGQEISWADATTNGLVKFRPDADWNGTTQFLHSVNDPWSDGSRASVTLRVANDYADGPVAGTFSEVGRSDAATAIVGWNWTTVHGHTARTVEITSLPEHGTLFFDRNGDNVCSPCEVIHSGWTAKLGCGNSLDKIKFMPDDDWTGSTEFNYRVNDGCENGQDAVVTIVVDDAPQAGSFSASGNENAAIVVDGWNYTDPQADPAAALKIEALPGNGTLFLDSNANNVLDPVKPSQPGRRFAGLTRPARGCSSTFRVRISRETWR